MESTAAMEESLLYSLLANELEIAGLRAAQSHTPDQNLSRPSYTNKRLHTSDGHRSSPIRISPTSPDRVRAASFSGSYSQAPPGSAFSSEEALPWIEEDALAPAPPVQVSSSAPGGASAVARLKMLLASNSTVRQAALKLLLQPKKKQQEQQLQQLKQQQQQQLQAAPQEGALLQKQRRCSWLADACSAPTASTQLNMLRAATGNSFTGGSSPFAGSNPSLLAAAAPDGSPQHSPDHTGPLTTPKAAFLAATAAPSAASSALPAPMELHNGTGAASAAAVEAHLVAAMEQELLGSLGLGDLNAPSNQSTVQPRSHRHRHAPPPQEQLQQQQQAAPWKQQQLPQMASAPLPVLTGVLAAPAAAAGAAACSGPLCMQPLRQHRHPLLSTLDMPGATAGDCSPDPVSSSSSNSNGMVRSGLGSSHSLASRVPVAFSMSQPLPQVNHQELPWAAANPGFKRANSIEQDQLLMNLLQELTHDQV